MQPSSCCDPCTGAGSTPGLIPACTPVLGLLPQPQGQHQGPQEQGWRETQAGWTELGRRMGLQQGSPTAPTAPHLGAEGAKRLYLKGGGLQEHLKPPSSGPHRAWSCPLVQNRPPLTEEHRQ